ncbi:GNAT family [Colletotrichum musicola]|uniref:GNAT family n=1 Tax=Colletotrichum musicola TaxID=2175873 RepID=A0A8H6JR72_9PEZI|nr:GNAT family [Colletotrichum musicola]
MPLKLRPATAADAPSLAPIYFSAFGDNPILQNCFPPSSDQCRKFTADAFTKEFDDPRARILVVSDPDNAADPEEIIAWAKWVRPAAEGEENVEPPPPVESWPSEGNPRFADEFFGGIGRRHAALMGDVRHWYLELIVCHKDHQGKGAASPLLRWGCDRADEDGLVAFLEAVTRAKVVYQKYGFETVETMDFKAPSGEALTQHFMLRKGKATQDYEKVLENVKSCQ